MTTILLVDDDLAFREQLARAFQRRGYQVAPAADYFGAIERLRDTDCHLAVIDLRMPGPSGMKLLTDLRERSPHTQVVVLTGYGSIANAVEALRLGAVNYVSKPAHADEILAAFPSLNLRPAPPHDPRLAAHDEDEFPEPSLAQVEWDHIQRILADCDGNVSHAARRLGIPRRSLQRKLRRGAPD